MFGKLLFDLNLGEALRLLRTDPSKETFEENIRKFES